MDGETLPPASLAVDRSLESCSAPGARTPVAERHSLAYRWRDGMRCEPRAAVSAPQPALAALADSPSGPSGAHYFGDVVVVTMQVSLTSSSHAVNDAECSMLMFETSPS
jgi:hypothetical protein